MSRKKLSPEQLNGYQLQQLNESWDDISEKYSKSTDASALDRAIGNKSFLGKCQAELEVIKACQELMEWSEAGVKDIDYLTPLYNIGISGSAMQIKLKIAQKKAKLRILIAKFRTEQENIQSRLNDILVSFMLGNIDEEKMILVADEFEKLSKRLKELSNIDQDKGSFYADLSAIGKILGHHIPSDILLTEWCGYLYTIRKMNKKD